MNKTYTIHERLIRRVRRIGLATVLGGLLLGDAEAQTANLYSFTTSTGETLRDMTGASALIGLGGFNSAVTAIGFPFNYEGTSYTQFSANNYGGMRLGNTVIQDYQVQNLYSNPPVLLPFSVDGDQASSSASYLLEGSAPSRILTVQWVHQNYSWDGGQLCTFQASLHEGTNTIEFRYGTGGITSPWKNFLAIGGAVSTDFLNIQSNHTVSSVNDISADAWPGNGRMYTFTPPAPCVTPTPGNTLASISSGCSGYSSALSMQNATSGSGVSYQWQSSPNGVDTWTNVGTNSATHTTGPLTATTWFHCLVTCTTGPDVVSSTPIQLTVSEPAVTYFTYAGAQFNEAFDLWGDRCSSGDVPSLASNHWKNAPSFGPGTWRTSTTTQLASGWNNVSGGFFSTTVAPNPNAVAVTLPAARFHSRQGSSVVGTLDFHVNMSAATGTELVRFEYINSAGNGNMSVWVSTNGGTSFAQVGSTLTATAINTWETKEFAVGSTSATTVIRLRGIAGAAASGNDIGVDNFRIIPAAACPVPTAPTANVVGAGAVNLAWTCASCTGTYYVEYGIAGFTLGTGTVVGPFATNAASLTGLANGNYQAYVRQDCGVAGPSSNVGPMTFSIVPGDYCSNAINLATLPNTDWSIIASTTNAHNDISTSACHPSMPGQDVVIYHDVEAGATISAGFWSSANLFTVTRGGACPGSTSLACSAGGYLVEGANVQMIDDFQTLVWTNTGCDTERIFIIADGIGAGGSLYVFNYAYTPGAGALCTEVDGITTNTVNTGSNVQVSWSGTCTGNVVVEYGPAGFNPGSGATANAGTVVLVNGTSTTLTGLDLDVAYDVYVRNDCGGQYSTNGTPTTFTIISGDDCTRAIDLSLAEAPIMASTMGANNDVSAHGCGTFSGGDLVLFHPVAVGATISLFASHDYSAVVSVLYGTTCLGSTELTCEAALEEYTWTNTTGEQQNLYWIQDGNAEGDFILEWFIETPCELGTTGSPCDAGPLFASGIVTADCECEGQDPIPCTNNLNLEFQNDGNAGQVTWEVLNAANLVVLSGANPIPNNQIGAQAICLPDGCYRLRVLDSGGDGMTTGGYELRTQGTNERLIDNSNNFSNGTVSAIAGNQGFCLPIGTDKVIFSSCDKLDWVANKFIVCHANPAVSAQFGASNATSGYEFWFFDPNGSYSFRRFRSHATSDGYGTGATRACHFKVNGWTNTVATPHLPNNVLLNVRVRGRVAGSNLEFGPACQFKLDAVLAACPRVRLQDDPANVDDFSCGVFRNFGGGSNANNRITANPPQPIPVVASSNVRYQFRFRIPGEGICIVRPSQTSARLVLNWNSASGAPLQCSKTYEVDVRVSLDGGATWCFGPATSTAAAACADAQPWGKVCNVTINPCAQQGGGNTSITTVGIESFTMYPNPNRGDQLFLSVNSLEEGVNTVNVDVFDLTGKRVMARTIAVQEGFLNTNLELNGEIAGGLYLVNITAGTKVHTERLVIQP